MGQDSLVSVIMPMHNAAGFVEAAVRSILTQTWQSLEFIIVDDASTDDGLERVRRFKDPRLRIIENPTNSGVARSLNVAIEASRGIYLARMDADDISRSSRLAAQVAFLSRNPDVVAVGTRVRYTGGPLGLMDLRPLSRSECDAFLLLGPPLCHPAVMMRRDVLERHALRYRPEFTVSEDYDLWCRLSEHGALVNLREALLTYRLHAQQVTTLYPDGMGRQQRELIQGMMARRGIELDSALFDDYCRMAACRTESRLEDMRKALVALEALIALEKGNRDALRQMLALAWGRYCLRNMHMGWAIHTLYRESGLCYSGPGGRRLAGLLGAGSAWHTLRSCRRERGHVKH